MTAQEVSEQVVAPLDSLGELLADLLAADMDTTAAMDSVVTLFEQDPNVDWAMTGQQGVAVQFENGIRGGIFVDPEDAPVEGDAPPNPTKMQNDASISAAKASEPKALFLNPSNYQRRQFAEAIMTNYDRRLTPADYAPLDYFLDYDAGLNAYTHLSNYRIVHIYSHGWAWPRRTAIEEIYLMSGETWNETLYESYWQEFHSGAIPLVKELHGPDRLFVSPQFIANHNDFSGKGTLFYGGFCYSFLGTWPTTITEKAHAAGYMGFNWSVRTDWNAAWNQNLMWKMLKTGQEAPLTPPLWLSDSYPKQYWNPRMGFWVSVRYQGTPNLTLVKPPDCSDTEIAEPFSGYVRIHVVTGAAAGTKLSYRYGKIHCDGHVSWVGPYEGEIGPGGEYWGAMVGIMDIANTQDVIIARAVVNGITRETQVPAASFYGSNLFLPVEAKVAYY